jgi:phosphoadenosine phosphosulfate reductase
MLSLGKSRRSALPLWPSLEAKMDALEIARESERLAAARPEEILAYAFDRFRGRIAISTAFGAEGCALIDIAHGVDPSVPIFSVDTGFAFRETTELRRRIEEKYGITVKVYRPELTVAQQAEKYGERLYERDPDRCCAMRKVEPLQRALKELDAWVSSRRRDMAATRVNVPVLEVVVQPDGRDLCKVNPFVTWTRKDVWSYLSKHDVPYNPLYDQSYASISCWPCTRPIHAGEPERAGRWSGTGKVECGIHTFMAAKKTA